MTNTPVSLICNVLLLLHIANALTHLYADTRFLFEAYPKGTLKVASLLESLASYQCAKTTPEDVLDDDLYDDEDVAAFDSTVRVERLRCMACCLNLTAFFAQQQLSDIKAIPIHAGTSTNPEFLSKTSLEEEEDREFAPIPIDDIAIAQMTSSLKEASLNSGVVPQGSLSSSDDPNAADSPELALLEASQAVSYCVLTVCLVHL